MGSRRTRGAALRAWSLRIILVATVWGCAALPPNSFLDPTKVGRFGSEVGERGIRQVLTPRDTPPGVAGATEPAPEDLVPNYVEYRLGAGDVVQVTVQDLISPGQPYQAAIEVNPSGEIRLPVLGSVKVAGLSESEVEQEITNRLREANLLPRPIVLVIAQARRGQQYQILGAVARAGPYPIPEPDWRLLDAISLAGDVSATARRAYVIRRADTARVSGPTAPRPASPPANELIIPPADEPLPATLASATGTGRRDDPPPPTREDLADVMTPPAETTKPAAGAPPAGEQPFPQLIFDPETGAVIEARGVPPTPEPAPPGAPPKAPGVEIDEPFDWEDVEELALDQRVIAIDLTELRRGNPRFNIVVRNRDVIEVPVDTGLYYMMGEIARPGAYPFGGRDITIKQAIAAAGGMTALAFPSRCEIIRREPGTEKQLMITVNVDRIFAGLEDDFYLRDDDIVNVGTHFVAPFLFVIRNSFRFTYGFGFVYDRNFADKDAYSARINPETLAIDRANRRGLPF
mgnify:CR=1 FL=1